MGKATITTGPEAWVGSGAPNKVHQNPPMLKLHSLAAYAFIKRHTPVPPGDGVGVGQLMVCIAKDATGTFVLTGRRTADAPDWDKLTWNNQPGVTGSNIPTATVTNPTAGTWVTLDVAVHLQTVSDGSKHYGWRIESNQASDLWIYGDDSENAPKLYAEWSPVPATPTDLTPSGTIATDRPVLGATADDVTGEDEVAAVQWQIDPASSTSAPAFDSGTVTADALELDLTTTTYAGLAEGATTNQRCRWQNQSGVWSGWSDWYPFTRRTPVAPTMSYPGADGLVHDLTPILLATVDASVDHYRYQIVDPNDTSNVLASSGKIATKGNTTASWEVPAHVLVDGGNYRMRLDTWDDDTRVPTPGHPRYLRTTRDFTVDEVNTVETPVLVSVAGHPTLPANVLTITTSTPPDTFTVYQDDDAHMVQVDAVDSFVSGTTYEILDYDFTYMDPHDYQVRSVQDGNRSRKSGSITVTTTPSDVWVIRPKTGQCFMVEGQGIDDWGRVDIAGQYQVHGAELQVVITAGSSGYTGSMKGSMRAAHGRTLASLRRDRKAIEGLGAAEPVIIRAANLSVWATLLDCSGTPHPQTLPSNPRDQVSFRFVQAPKPAGN